MRNLQSEETQQISQGHGLYHEKFILSWEIQVDVPGIIQVLWTESSKTCNVRILHALINATHCFSYVTKGEGTCHLHFGTQEIPDECQPMA